MCCHNIDALNVAFPDVIFPLKHLKTWSQVLLPVILLMVAQWSSGTSFGLSTVRTRIRIMCCHIKSRPNIH